jgi:gliding motility-associated-like protein
VDGQSIELSDIGMFLHVDSTDIKYRSQNRLRPMYCNNIPQIRNKHGFIRYTGEWERVDGIFKARGGEHKLIIAYFKSDTSIERLDSTKAYIDEANGYFGFKTYFFIDSVTLYEIPCLVAQDTACKGDSVHFYHTFSGNAIWTTNPDSTQHIVGMDSVYSFVADKSGWYYVFTSTGKDSTYLTVIQPPSLTLGMDTFYCKQGNVTLIANGRNMQQYRWQDGSAGNMFTVNKPGWYWLTVSNAGCSATDSVYVTEQPLPEQLTQHQFTICTVTQQYATLALNTNYIYHWQTLTDTFNQITFIQAGCEKVTIESEYGCMTKDEVCIEDVCGVKVFVPNAFVPRGVNATFKPVTKYVSTIHWEVYNRWGERVFAADDLDASWDGTFNGALCNSDVYFYKVTYTDLVNPEPQTIKGNVTLIR